MNFLAHCYLAQPTGQSLVGNLLGDFTRGANLESQPSAILLGLENHQAVDKFTDTHSALIPLKESVSKQRRRFVGIMSDVVFDYFLTKHWKDITDQDFDVFVDHCYQEIEASQAFMHARMQQAMLFMLRDDGLRINSTLEGVGKTLNRVAHKIRFKNSFHGAVEEIEANYAIYEQAFLTLFPELEAHIQLLAIEV